MEHQATLCIGLPELQVLSGDDTPGLVELHRGRGPECEKVALGEVVDKPLFREECRPGLRKLPIWVCCTQTLSQFFAAQRN